MHCILEGKRLSFHVSQETSLGKEHVKSTCPCDRVYILSLLSMWKGSHQSLLAGKLRTGDKHDCLASLIYLISRVAFIVAFFKDVMSGFPFLGTNWNNCR